MHESAQFHVEYFIKYKRRHYSIRNNIRVQLNYIVCLTSLCVSPDPFIKIRVYNDGKRIYSKRTSTKYNMMTPNFMESFDVIVTKNRMAKTAIILKISHRSSCALYKNITIGAVLIGDHFHFSHEHFMLQKAMDHWATIMKKPYVDIEEYHPIQACLSWYKLHSVPSYSKEKFSFLHVSLKKKKW